MIIKNLVYRLEPKLSGGYTSSNPLVSALITPPASNVMGKKYQHHVSNQTPILDGHPWWNTHPKSSCYFLLSSCYFPPRFVLCYLHKLHLKYVLCYVRVCLCLQGHMYWSIYINILCRWALSFMKITPSKTHLQPQISLVTISSHITWPEPLRTQLMQGVYKYT